VLYGSILTYFTIFLEKRFQSDPIILGSFVSVLGLLTAIASFTVGRLSKKFSSLTLVIIAFVFYAVSTAIIPLMPNVWMCLIPIALFGIGHGLNLPSLTEIGSKIAPLEHRAGFMAIQMTMIPLGMTIGAPLMGFFYGITGSLEMTFYIGGAIALIIPVMSIFIKKQNFDSDAS
jgi:MFS family permease